MSGTGVVNAAKINPCRHRDTDSVNNHSVHPATVNGLNGFEIGTLMPKWTKAYVSAWNLKWVGHKRHSRQGRIEK